MRFLEHCLLVIRPVNFDLPPRNLESWRADSLPALQAETTVSIGVRVVVVVLSSP